MCSLSMWACSHTCTRRLFFFGSGVVTSATSLLLSVVLPLDFERLCGTVFRANRSPLSPDWAKLAHKGNEWEEESRSTCSREPLPTLVLRVCNTPTLGAFPNAWAQMCFVTVLKEITCWCYEWGFLFSFSEAVCVHMSTGDFVFAPFASFFFFCCNLWR